VPPAEASPATLEPTPPRVLLLDDEVRLLKALERSLVSEGFRIWTASEPDAAFDILGQQPIDVVVSDYRMPHTDGVTFLEEIRRRKPEARRVLLTGQADINSLAEAINHGAIHRLFLKPWDHLDLVTALREESQQGRLAERAEELRRVADRRSHELELARRLLQVQRMAAVGQLAAGIAHEINNPLATILTFSQILLREGKLSAEDIEAVQFIEQSARRCKRVIEAVVKFGVPSHAEPTEVKLEELAQETQALLQPELRHASVEVETTFESPAPLVHGSFQDLQQVVNALLRNAIEAFDAKAENRRIKLSVFSNDRFACFAVNDNGRGISPEVRDRIFDPFFSTKPEGEGAGLGLTIAERIAQTHGGEIAVVSVPGSGTTATLSLPKLEPNSEGPR
jgi:signal transduction histidine kinase